MSWLLGKITAKVLGYFLLAVFLALLAFGGAQTVRLAWAQVALAVEKKARATDEVRAQAALTAESERYRKAEQDMHTSFDKEISDAKAQLKKSDDDLAATRVVRDGLRKRVTQLTSAYRAVADAPGAPAGSADAADTIRVLAELYRRADERAEVLANVAQQRAIALNASNASYEKARAVIAALNAQH